MRKSLLAVMAALLSLSVIPIDASAQSFSVTVGDRPNVVRQRTIVRERDPDVYVTRRRTIVEEDDEECRIVKRKVRRNGRLITRTVRIGCD